MAQADEQTITCIPISCVDTVALLTKIYQSQPIAEEKVARWLVAGLVRWDCLELIGMRRAADPGRGDPAFWRGLPKSAIHLSEGWARRREVEFSRRQRGYITLCNYKAVGLVLAREDVIGLLPPAEQARLAEEVREAEAVREAVRDAVSTPVDRSSTAAEPKRKERRSYWDDEVDRVLREHFRDGGATNFEAGEVVRMVLDALASEIKSSGRQPPSRGLILRKSGHWRS